MAGQPRSRGKGKTRRRDLRDWQAQTATREGWKTARYAITSAGQGKRRGAVSVACGALGGVSKVLARVMETGKGIVADAAGDVDAMGTGFWAIAAIDEGGQVI